MVDRREFLRLSASAALGLSLIEAGAKEAPAEAAGRIRRYVRLGRTELSISGEVADLII